MKKINYLIILLLSLFVVTSCDEAEDHLAINEDNVKSELTLSAEALTLSADNLVEDALTITMSKVDYGFDLTDSNNRLIITMGDTSKDLVLGTESSKTFSSEELNSLLIGLGAEAGVETTVTVQGKVIFGSKSLLSEKKTITVTPYATSFPPIYMTGAALGGWDWTTNYKIVPSSEANVYTTLAHFTQGEAFRFFVQQDWGPTSYNYPYFTTVSNLLENANDGDKNFKVLGESGWYRITADLKTKTVAMENVDEPLLFMTGAALGGWDWDTNYVKMKFVQEGVFTAKTEFSNGETFRFFLQKGWGDSYNYPYFAKVDEDFENAEDGDKNLKFIGATGEHTVTVNLNDKTVELE